jgi:hypothetical protein
MKLILAEAGHQGAPPRSLQISSKKTLSSVIEISEDLLLFQKSKPHLSFNSPSNEVNCLINGKKMSILWEELYDPAFQQTLLLRELSQSFASWQQNALVKSSRLVWRIQIPRSTPLPHRRAGG